MRRRPGGRSRPGAASFACEKFHKRVDSAPVKRREEPTSREMGEGQRYLALGMNFGLGIVVFALVGLWLDRRLGSIPAFTIGGTVLGSVLSFLNVYWKLAELERKRREREGKQ